MQRWDDVGLARLRGGLVREMLRFTAVPLGGGPVVRGVVPVPGRGGVGRVVVWDGRDIGTSVAYDLPLLDRQGDHRPPFVLVAVLRRAVRQMFGDLGAVEGRDGHGIPVVPLDVGEPVFDLTDALQAAAAGIVPSGGGERGEELGLSGFLLLDRDSARLYVAGEGLTGVVGLDVSLSDGEGAVSVGVTGLAAALPSLVADDQLRYNPSDAVDPYCSQVFDLTHW
ncbi:hypothetical protein ABZX85_33345 [Streptomyces sp. NPDC004539]|uniref:hypothetical protein n=1 Tax=Streptomyces sp. NPDC004539 TaxID=3154280 RepID=UPI0033A8B722